MSMDIDTPVSIPSISAIPQTAATILCCNCGAPIDGTKAAGALCYDCVKLTIDISEGIPREATIHTCRDCERWLQPPQSWVTATPESRELLALCLRKLRGLNKVRIIDASFIWTEPHSRRVKVKITIQSEPFTGTILQQTFEVEYVVAYHQCPDCAKSFTANTWRAVVQVRQKVPHKRTFLYLEQLILKHSAHKDTINIAEVKDGLDFFFAQRNHAEKFVDFLNSVAPVRVKKSQELISMDIHTSTKSYKFSFSVELVPICKDDLVALPLKLAKQVGNITPITLCYRIGTSVNLLDPTTLQTADLSTPIYWRAPFAPLADVTELVEYIVMDIDVLGVQKGRFFLAEATVARASDLGHNSQTFYTRTHLGAILHPGDSVMGYHLTGTNFNNPHYEVLEEKESTANLIPDVILVKKLFARKRKGGNQARNWKLKRMGKEESEMLARKQDRERAEKDFEMFLRDIEEDEEMRGTMALYKARQEKKARDSAKARVAGAGTGDKEGMDVDGQDVVGSGGDEEVEEVDDDEEGDGDGPPDVNLDELLDDFDDLSVGDEERVA
ncbi:hypothetical protein MMC25_005655 [Agyrium rufum]|nr:hypothetical protein [Agyrium rufum]